MKRIDESAGSSRQRLAPFGSRCALVVEDDPPIADLIKETLSANGFHVVVAGDGLAALRRAREHDPEVVVLDVGLPGVDGFDVCRTLRKESAAPIVFVTARSAEIDRVVGLELGADDYVVKPFSPQELAARVRAIMRRAKSPPPQTTQRRSVGDLMVDIDRREASIAGRLVRLKPREFDLLWLFVRNEGRVFTRDQLIEAVWGYDWEGDPRTVDVHVRRIRRALADDAEAPRYLHTVHGLGYKFAAAK